MPNSKDILRKIREIRDQKGWSQEYVANQLGISQSQYSKLEKGISVMTLPTLEKICNLFEIEFDIFSLENKNSGIYEELKEIKNELKEIKEFIRESKMMDRMRSNTQYCISSFSQIWKKEDNTEKLWDYFVKNFKKLKFPKSMLNNNKVFQYYMKYAEYFK